MAVISGSTVAVSSITANDAVRTAEITWRHQRCQYRDLRQQKRSSFWQSTIEADRDSLRRLWKSVNTFLERGRPPVSSAIIVDDFNQYFIDKVAAVRASTDGASEPSFKSCVERQSLTAFMRSAFMTLPSPSASCLTRVLQPIHFLFLS